MGNEMGNSNTSELREEEQEKAEVGGNEVKEARLGSDGEDRVNGDHHIIKEEEEKNTACNTAEFQMVSEKLPDRTKENYEVQAKSKDDQTKEFDSEKKRSDGYEHEHEHEKQASNQKEKEEGTGFNLNTTILALDEPNLGTTSVSKSTRHELLDIKAESLVEDSNKSPEECKDALGLRLNNNYHSADNAMVAVSEETINMDRVIGIDRGTNEDNLVREKGSNFNVITQASEDQKSEKTSYFDANQFVDTNRDASKEDDRKREKDSNFDTMTRAPEDPKSEKTSDFDVDRILDTDRDTNKEDDRESVKGSDLDTITRASKDPKSEKTSDFDVVQILDTDRYTNKEDDRESVKGSNLDTMTRASKDPKSEKTSDFDVDQVLDTDRDTNKEDDRESVKGSNPDTITQASKDKKSEQFSDFDADQVIDTDQDIDNENDAARGKGSNFNTITQAAKDPKSEKTSNFDVDQNIDTEEDRNQEDDEKKGKGFNIDPTTQASVDSKLEKTSNFDVVQVIDTHQDMDEEHDTETGKGSNFKTLHVMEDLKFENNSDLKTIHHEIPATKAESLAGSSDDGSSHESKYCLSSSLKHTEGNGICAEPETDMEKKKGDLLEPRSCHKYTMPAAKIDDTKDEETAIDLIGHNPSCSPPEESLVIESQKSSMQVPEVEDKCTVLKEESQLREEHLGTETIIQDNIPTQSMISNAEEFNTIGSLFENDAEETDVSPKCVVENKNHNKSPGENYEDSDEEYLEISEQGMAILTSSIGDSKHMNEEMGETIEISTNIEQEAERREQEESLFEPHLGFQPQIHERETSIPFQSGERIDEPISTSKQEAKTTDSPHYIQTASPKFIETKPLTNSIDEQNVTTLPLTTFREEDQESPGRTSNESISDNSITHIEMRKSPSFNIDIQSEGRAGETEKIPLLYQTKAIEDLPNPMEKRVVKLGRSDSEKSRPSFPGFLKEKEESEMKFEAIDQQNIAAVKKAVRDLPAAPSPIRKGKRRSKSLIFGTCICCATAIN